MRVAALIALLLAGCTSETGIRLEVTGPNGTTSVAAGIVSLEFVAAHPTWCERWVRDTSVSATRVDVTGRDLNKSPYSLMIRPSRETDLSERVFMVALARDGQGRAVGQANFGEHRFEKKTIALDSKNIDLFAKDAPDYVSGNCSCVPGQPWIGDGSGTGCDLDVVTSFDRLVDTAGCELARGRPQHLGPVCDGQLYPGEVQDRELPCFATHLSEGNVPACVVPVRKCFDNRGYAYGHECAASSSTPSLPTSRLCDAFRACDTACGNVLGCFKRSVPPSHTVDCALRIDATTPPGTPIKPCADGKWVVIADPRDMMGAACVTSLLDGQQQGAFKFGLPGTVSASCPPTLNVESITAESPEAVPALHELDLTVGDQVVHVRIKVVRGCEAVSASFKCGIAP